MNVMLFGEQSGDQRKGEEEETSDDFFFQKNIRNRIHFKGGGVCMRFVSTCCLSLSASEHEASGYAHFNLFRLVNGDI